MPRRKMTAPGIDPDVTDALPELTANQMAFVHGIVAGKTASDAYRIAYDCENSTANTIWSAASKLRADAKVAQWIDAVKAAGFGRVSCSFDEHMTELARLRGIAERSGNIGAAVQAEQLRGKVAGHYVDKVQDVTPHDPIATLREIAQLKPEYAAELAAQAGIEWGAEQGSTKH